MDSKEKHCDRHSPNNHCHSRSRSITCTTSSRLGCRRSAMSLAVPAFHSARTASLLLCSLCFFLSLTTVFAQPGFLNIDCGYEHNVTNGNYGLNWVTDTGYASSGFNSGPVNYLGSDFRYFNDSRKKNCYKLPTQPHTTYLVRASFWYGNFSELAGNVSFDLTINNTYWTTIHLSPVIDWYADNPGVLSMLRKEAIFRSNGSQVAMCLLRGRGLPFITSLQLITLADNMYEDTKLGKLLSLQWRGHAGYCCIDTTRYPDDPYDRIWTLMDGFGTVSENSTILNTSTMDVNEPPSVVMSYAWESNSTTPSVWLYNALNERNGQYYIALYFQEVDALANSTETRGTRFLTASLIGTNVKMDVDVTSSLTAVTSLFHSASLTGANVSISKNAYLSLPPLLNGWEFYSAHDMSNTFTAPEDVASLDVLRSIPGFSSVLSAWSGDPCHPEPWEWIVCNVSRQPSKIATIDLSNMELTGFFPDTLKLGNGSGLSELSDLWIDSNMLNGSLPDFRGLNKLQTLHLQNNGFSGPVPDTLAELPLLHELFLQDNNFSGTIPPALLNRSASSALNFTFSYIGNPFLRMPGSATPMGLPSDAPSQVRGMQPDTKSSGSSSTTLLFAVGGGVLALVIVIAILVVFRCCFRNSVRRTHQEQVGVLKFDKESTKQARSFTYEEVKEVTHNFAKKLGEGSYGPVFYGRLADGTEVAVKVNHADSRQGTSEFINEIVLLSRVHHKYLVSLVGYCEASDQQILIYAYMPNSTLTEHLHGDVDEENRLSWRTRLDIALNAAQGLDYLHTFCNPPIIHRDVKPSNILLDYSYLAKVADFGMSKATPEGSKTGFSTAVKGTLGYLDPEYLTGWRLTEKSDVYSFGVVLLELITGRVPTAIIDLKDGTQGNFLSWTKTAQRNGNIHAMVDPSLAKQYNTETMWKVAELAWECVEPIGSGRPTMGEIVRGLQEAIQLENSDYIDVTSEPSAMEGSLFKSSSGYVNPNSSYTAPLKPYTSVASWDPYQPT